jgi:hypothetical protein
MKATELVEKLKNVFLSEEVAQDEVKDVEAQAEVISAELEAQPEVEEVVAEELAEAPVSSMEGEEKYATKEELAGAIAEMKAMYDAIMQNMKSEEQMEVPAELNEDLSSQEAAQPLLHSPEAEVSKQEMHLFAKNRPMTTLDLVMSKIAK